MRHSTFFALILLFYFSCSDGKAINNSPKRPESDSTIKILAIDLSSINI